MKKQILKILAYPKTVVAVTLVVVIPIGIWVYKNVGLPPQISLGEENSINSSSSAEVPSNENTVSLSFPVSGKVDTVDVSSGQSVKKGDMLMSLSTSDADGAISQAQGALEVAEANYDKILNGATGEDISVLQAAVNSAQVNLDQTKSEQDILVQNAQANLLDSGLQAVAQNLSSSETPPVISGTYASGQQGEIDISEYADGTGAYFTTTGLVTATGTVSDTTPQPIGSTGLFIQFADMNVANSTVWVIAIPNKQSSEYLTNLNAYQSAVSTQTQSVANSTAALNQAEANLSAETAQARPEDVALAKAQIDSANGALQVAEAAYNNDFIYAPADGVITSVDIQAGEIAIPNQEVINMTINSSDN